MLLFVQSAAHTTAAVTAVMLRPLPTRLSLDHPLLTFNSTVCSPRYKPCGVSWCSTDTDGMSYSWLYPGPSRINVTQLSLVDDCQLVEMLHLRKYWSLVRVPATVGQCDTSQITERSRQNAKTGSICRCHSVNSVLMVAK